MQFDGEHRMRRPCVGDDDRAESEGRIQVYDHLPSSTSSQDHADGAWHDFEFPRLEFDGESDVGLLCEYLGDYCGDQDLFSDERLDRGISGARGGFVDPIEHHGNESLRGWHVAIFDVQRRQPRHAGDRRGPRAQRHPEHLVEVRGGVRADEEDAAPAGREQDGDGARDRRLPHAPLAREEAHALERFPTVPSRSLGLSHSPDVQYFHTLVKAEDYFCLCNAAPDVWTDKSLMGLGGLTTLSLVLDRLRETANSDFAALVGRLEPARTAPLGLPTRGEAGVKPFGSLFRPRPAAIPTVEALSTPPAEAATSLAASAQVPVEPAAPPAEAPAPAEAVPAPEELVLDPQVERLANRVDRQAHQDEELFI